MVGDMKRFAISTATHALQCAATLLSRSTAEEEPLYFMADSSDLVHYMMTHNDTTIPQNHVVLSHLHIVARDQSVPNAHIDRVKGLPIHHYYGAFVDFFLAVHARCVTYGVGFYALFAAKVSGTLCRLRYAKETWGGTVEAKQEDEFCSLNHD